MNTQTTPSNNLDIWQSRVDDWRESGLPMNQYCQNKNLVTHQLSYYKRKFAAEQVPSMEKSTGFARVVSPGSAAGLTLRLPNGFVIEGIGVQNVSVVSRLIDSLS